MSSVGCSNEPDFPPLGATTFAVAAAPVAGACVHWVLQGEGMASGVVSQDGVVVDRFVGGDGVDVRGAFVAASGAPVVMTVYGGRAGDSKRVMARSGAQPPFASCSPALDACDRLPCVFPTVDDPPPGDGDSGDSGADEGADADTDGDTDDGDTAGDTDGGDGDGDGADPGPVCGNPDGNWSGDLTVTTTSGPSSCPAPAAATLIGQLFGVQFVGTNFIVYNYEDSGWNESAYGIYDAACVGHYAISKNGKTTSYAFTYLTTSAELTVSAVTPITAGPDAGQSCTVNYAGTLTRY